MIRGFVALRFPMTAGGRRKGPMIRVDSFVDLLEQGFNGLITGHDLLLSKLIGGVRLTKDKKMFLSIRALQGFGDLFFRGLDPEITILREDLWSAFPVQNGLNNPKASGSGDITDDGIQDQVHLM